MKPHKLMGERIRRVKILFKELGYQLIDSEKLESSYTASFENIEGRQGGLFIDKRSRFLEVSFTFFFASTMTDFLRDRLEEMMKICYEYGCYINIDKTDSEICFSIFDKIYYVGLNYYSLKQSLYDFFDCINTLSKTLEISNEEENIT